MVYWYLTHYIPDSYAGTMRWTRNPPTKYAETGAIKNRICKDNSGMGGSLAEEGRKAH